MRKIIVLLLLLALPAELYWLYQQGSLPNKQKPAPTIPQSNPVQRLVGSPEAAMAIENSKRQLPKGPAGIRGILRDVSGGPASDVVVVATPAVEFGAIPPLDQPKWSATSDTKGEFQLELLPYNNYVLSAVDGEKHWIEQIELDKEFQFLELRPLLKASLSLRGRVVDARGKDVSGARIYPVPSLEEADKLLQPDELHRLNSYRFLPATTDEEGEFLLEHLPERPWRLLLTADGLANTLTEAITPPHTTLALVMDTGIRLEVELRLPDGQSPAANLNIELIEQQYGLEKFTAPTDATGKFFLDKMRPANWRFVALDSTHILPEGLRKITTSKDETTKTISANLDVGGVIVGHVLKKVRNASASGILVKASTPDGADTYNVYTDKEGVYRFTAMMPGTYKLAPQLSDEFVLDEAVEQTFQIQAQQEISGPDFILVKSISVKGLVLDGRDEPAREAVVRLETLAEPPGFKETKCNKDGRFSFHGLKEGEKVRLSATAEGMASNIYGPSILGKMGLNSVNLILSQPNRGGIVGSVVNPQGSPIPNALVLCQPDESLKLDTLKIYTGKFGDFQFNDLVPGTYTLSTGHSAEAMAPSSTQKITLAPNVTMKNIQLLLP